MQKKTEKDSVLSRFMTWYVMWQMLFWLVVFVALLSYLCLVLTMRICLLPSRVTGGKLTPSVAGLIILLSLCVTALIKIHL